MHAGELLNNLARKAGIDVSSAELKDLLSNAELLKVNIPDTISNALETQLLTVEAAQANDKVLKHFRSTLYNGIDNTLKETALEMGIPETELKTWLAENQTGKNVRNVMLKIAELKEKQSKGKGDNTELQKQIETLNAKIVEMTKAYQEKEQSLIKQNEQALTNYMLDSFLSNYDYGLPTTKDISLLTAKNVLNQEFSKLGITVVNENGQLVPKTKEGADYYTSNHTKPSIKELTDGVLAQHKLLKTAEPAQPARPTQQHFSGNGSEQPSSTRLMSALDQSLADLGTL